jgi:isoquinoline 1-oxidoreductase alpha subunit
MIELAVNGIQHRFDGDPATPLLWLLRDELGLMGTRFGCGAGLCGCCTVHVGKDAVRSCITPVAGLNGASVTTIEGLGAKGLHPLQAAWVEHAVPQCGYCQSGQIMQAAALLRANPRPSDAEIDGAMSGNLCRCGTYPRIRIAIQQVASGKNAGKVRQTPAPAAKKERVRP